jgi:CheY-like chemotaxis protein
MQEGLAFSILVVDDDEDNRMMIDEAFMQIGSASDVKKFINGKGLFHYLSQIDASLYPSLIVLDNILPDIDADNILRLLKQNTAYQAIPVVIYTTMLSPSKKQQLLSMGAYACFEKGNSLQEIVEVAKELRRFARDNRQT